MSNLQPKVSIVSAVYNTSPDYLKAAFDSVRNQTYKNIEYIVVDDGSDKKTAGFCDLFWKKEIESGKVRVVHNKNNGVSYSRNCGLDLADGEYIVFLDSDDVLDVNFVTVMLEAVKKNALKVAVCDYSKKAATNASAEDISDLEVKKYSGSDIWKNLNTAYIWRTIYSADVIRNIRFDPSKKCCEDVLFFNEVLRSISSIGYVPLELYYYRQIPTSITHRYSSEICRDAIETYEGVYFTNTMVTKSRTAYSEVFTNYSRWLIRYLTAVRKEGRYSDFCSAVKMSRKKTRGRTNLIKKREVRSMISLLRLPCFINYGCVAVYDYLRKKKAWKNKG